MSDEIHFEWCFYLFPGKIEEQVRDLLEYPNGSVGRIMTSDFLSFRKDLLARDAIARIRALSKKRVLMSYAYVVDDENRLVGVLNMRDLMIAAPQASLDSIFRKDVFTVHCFVDMQEAANELAKRKYFAAAVVDSENHILGIIKAERMLRCFNSSVDEKHRYRSSAKLKHHPDDGNRCHGFSGLSRLCRRKPMLINRYSIFIRDIEPKGFDLVVMDGYLTPANIGAVRDIIDSVKLREKITNHNYTVAQKHFSYAVLRKRLSYLVNVFFGEETIGY